MFDGRSLTQLANGWSAKRNIADSSTWGAKRNITDSSSPWRKKPHEQFELKDIPLKQKYIFPQSALAECIRIGKERYMNNRRAKVREQKYTMKKSGIDLSVQGVIGEYGILEMFGLDKKTLQNTAPNSRYNDRGDMIYKKLKVDIKCPEGHHCPLQTRSESREFPSHIYALCTMFHDRKVNNNPKPRLSESTPKLGDDSTPKPSDSTLKPSGGDSTPKPSDSTPKPSDSTLKRGDDSTLKPSDSTLKLSDSTLKLSDSTLKLSGDSKSDFESTCTYSDTDYVEVMFQGCVCSKKLFSQDNLTERWGNMFYMYPQSDLCSLEDAYRAQTGDVTVSVIPTVSTTTTTQEPKEECCGEVQSEPNPTIAILCPSVTNPQHNVTFKLRVEKRKYVPPMDDFPQLAEYDSNVQK